tara:strand:+ start:442 stop:660 length:219 start_codon:yes stop_codon:yes gene_type:complete
VLELLNEMGYREPEDYEDFDVKFLHYCNQIEKEYNSHLIWKQYPLSFTEWFVDNYNNMYDWDNLKLIEENDD